jgi:hypothetical protein
MIKGKIYRFDSNCYYQQFEGIETMLFFFPLIKEKEQYFCAQVQYARVNVYNEAKKYSNFNYVFLTYDSILLTSKHLETPFKHSQIDDTGTRRITNFLILFCPETREFVGLDRDFEKFMIEE